MVLLFVALFFHFTVFRVITSARDGRFPPIAYRITGIITLVLWFAVGCAGRAIAFF